MIDLICGDDMPIAYAGKTRIAYYHNLSVESPDSVVSDELLKYRNKQATKQNGCWKYADTYIDHAYGCTGQSERPAFGQMIADARSGKFDLLIVRSLDGFTPTVEDTLNTVEELLALPSPVTIRFVQEMLDSEIIHAVIPILRGCRS